MKSADRRRAASLGLALAALAVAGLARAQISPTTNGPIDITADEADVVNATCVTTWKGAAEALQGSSRLRADTITAYLKPKAKSAGQAAAAQAADAQTSAGPANIQSNCGPTDKIEADGHVFYQTPTQIAAADHAVYTADDGLIVMTGNVIVVQGKNVARGDKMIIHVQSRDAQLISDAKGRGTPGRVRAVLYPSQSPQGGAAAPALP